MAQRVGNVLRTRLRASSQRPRLRLAGLMLLAAVISLVLVEIAWLSFSYFLETSRVGDKAERRTRMLLEAAVDPLDFPTLSNEKAVLDRLTSVAHIVGARLEDTAGEPLAVVGEEPDVTVLEAMRDRIGARKSADARYLDIYVPAESLKFEHPMVVRVNLDPYYSEVAQQLTNTALTVVNIVVLTTTGLFLALYPILFRPLSRIRDAIMRGVNDLDIADSFMIKWNREDELDDLARAVNQLLFAASKNYNDTLHTAHETLSNSLVATFVYKPGGELTYANPAAMELLGATDLDQLAKIDPAFVKLKDKAKEPPETVEEMLADGPVADDGEILTPGGPRAMICMGDITYRTDGSIRRIIGQFLDMDRAMSRMARLATMSERATRRRILADQRSLRLRVMLESCLSILDDDEERLSVGVELITAEPAIKEWARVYAAVGKARRVLYNRLPQLSGNPHIIATLFRQALSYADFVSAYRDSEFRVIGTALDHEIRFSISETVADDSTPKEASEITRAGELTLTQTSLSRLVEKCEGTLDLEEDEEGTVKFSFTVPKVIHSHAAATNRANGRVAA